jgi:uncharacterized protein YPO0396
MENNSKANDANLLPGFRLNYLQVYNWGLYNGDIGTISPEENSSLLIGANASGKSTLVDALLTLFLSKPKFNLAGDANKKNDRDLISYVRGAYMNKTNAYGNIETLYLRERSEFSFILAGFSSAADATQNITLAQFFWFDTDEATAPRRLYIISETECLDLLEDLNINTIKSDKDLKNILKRRGIYTETDSKQETRTGLQTDKYSIYSNKISELFGFRNKDKALHLFNQTVALKNVGDLTLFIRSEMLDELNVDSEITKLQETFEAAKRMADKIADAEKKLIILNPINEGGYKYKNLEKERIELDGGISAAPAYFSTIKKGLIETEMAEAVTRHKNATERYDVHFNEENGTLLNSRNETDVIKAKITLQENKVGIAAIDSELTTAVTHLNRVTDNLLTYKKHAEILSFNLPSDRSQFSENQKLINEFHENYSNQILQAENERETILKKIAPYEVQRDDIENKLQLLNRSRENLLEEKFLEARKTISERLNIAIAELPFVCELIQVKQEHKDWLPVIEKLLKPFALNLIIQKDYYERAGGFINDFTFNDVKINFFRLEAKVNPLVVPVNKAFLYHKLEFKSDTRATILENVKYQVAHHHDYLCCEKEELFKVRRAITKAGLIKRGENFHEKDDRKDSNRASSFILGWDNRQKIDALKSELVGINNKLAELEKDSSLKKAWVKELKALVDSLSELKKMTNFAEIDKESAYTKVKALERQLEALKNDQLLAELNSQLKVLLRKIRVLDYAKTRSVRYIQSLKTKLESYEEELLECEQTINSITIQEKERSFPIIEKYTTETITLASQVNKVQGEVIRQLRLRQRDIDADMKPLFQSITQAMTSFGLNFSEETKRNDLSIQIEMLDEYLRIYNDIKNENLPQYKEDFNKKIRDQTDARVTDLRRLIFDEKKNIEDRINFINETLRQRHYEKDRTFIQIVPREIEEQEIEDFKKELIACFYSVGKQQTAEERDRENLEVFNNIQILLDKLKLINVQDKGRWAKKVTDVRNWFVFSASERDVDDPSVEIKAHAGTAGQSGGETSKITYTILASAITYQFGLDKESTRLNSLRFIAIDEIFNNLGEKWCHYVLEMFRDMNLQILIVSPDSLEKVYIADRYVRNVHWTYKRTIDDKDKSVVINIPKREMIEKLKAVG